jgi:hypothetical protein
MKNQVKDNVVFTNNQAFFLFFVIILLMCFCYTMSNNGMIHT